MNEDVWDPIEHGDFPASHVSFQGCHLVLTTSDILKWLLLVRNSQVELVSHWALRPKAQAGRDTYSGWHLAIFKGFFEESEALKKDLKDLEKQGSDFYISCLWRFFTEILFELSLLFSNVRLSHSFKVGNGKLTVLSEPLWRWVSFEQWKRPGCLVYLGLYGPGI